MKGKLLTRGIGLLLALLLCCTGLVTASADTPAAAQNVATGGIDVNILFSKTSYKVGSTLTATYTVKGGSGPYTDLYCWCYSVDNDQQVFSKYVPLKGKTSGTIKFKPKYGQEAYIELYARDSKGKYVYVTSDRVALTGAKETEPVQVKITFDKDSYAYGENVTANYQITGGSGQYPYIQYSVYGGGKGSSVYIKQGTLKRASGTIKFQAYKGDYAYINLYGQDSENRSFSESSNSVELTEAKADDPIKVKITFKKSSYKAGDTVVAKYKITGGSGKYKNIWVDCTGTKYQDNEYTELSYKSEELTASSGTIKFTVKSGVKARVTITGYDSKGRGVNGQSGWVTIQGAKDRENPSVKFTLSKTSYPLGSKIKVKYAITGGSGKYKDLFYNCYVFDNGQYKDYEQGSLKKDSGTISFAPNRGQQAYVYVHGTDSEGRNIWGDSQVITLTENTKPKAVKLSGVKAGKKQLTVTWGKGKDIDGYQIQYGRKADFSDAETISVKKATVTEKTISKLKGGKKYYVRVRTYKKVNGQTYYSDWSASKSKKTTK